MVVVHKYELTFPGVRRGISKGMLLLMYAILPFLLFVFRYSQRPIIVGRSKTWIYSEMMMARAIMMTANVD